MRFKEAVLKKPFFVCQKAQKQRVEEIDFKIFLGAKAPGKLVEFLLVEFLLVEFHFTMREILEILDKPLLGATPTMSENEDFCLSLSE